jgi:hypothetical protein
MDGDSGDEQDMDDKVKVKGGGVNQKESTSPICVLELGCPGIRPAQRNTPSRKCEQLQRSRVTTVVVIIGAV